MKQTEQKPHTGVELNWVGVTFILFCTITGALIALLTWENVLAAILIGYLCELAAAKIAGKATQEIRIRLNDIGESCYGRQG